MIEGMVVQMSSVELEAHLRARLLHHTKRAEFYRIEEEKFKKEAADAEIRQGQNTMVRTHDAMKEAANKHEHLITFFSFMADHLIPGEVYRFTAKDLGQIEVIEQSHYW